MSESVLSRVVRLAEMLAKGLQHLFKTVTLLNDIEIK